MNNTLLSIAVVVTLLLMRGLKSGIFPTVAAVPVLALLTDL